MLDLLITHATLPDGRQNMSIAVLDGRIAEVTEGLQAPAHETVDAGGLLVSPPLVDAHFPRFPVSASAAAMKNIFSQIISSHRR